MSERTLFIRMCCKCIDDNKDLLRRLAAWEALGESPEAVRAELEQLREALDRAHMRSMSVPLPSVDGFGREPAPLNQPRWTAEQVAAMKAEAEALRDKIARPTFDVPPSSHLARQTRPTPLAALEGSAAFTRPDVSLTGPMLVDIIQRARRAAGEVL